MKTIHLFLLTILLCITASNCAHHAQAPAAATAAPTIYIETKVVRISEEYANINTDISGVKLSKYGITDQQTFVVKYKDQTIHALLGKSYSDVAKGDWIALIEDDGNLQLAISFGHAATEMGCAVGDILYIGSLSSAK
jgi:S-adenosylmethionine hydrolase